MIGNSEMNIQSNKNSDINNQKIFYTNFNSTKKNNLNSNFQERLRNIAENENLNFLRILFKFKNLEMSPLNKIPKTTAKKKPEKESNLNLKNIFDSNTNNNVRSQNCKNFNTHQKSKSPLITNITEDRQKILEDNSISSIQSFEQDSVDLNEDIQLLTPKSLNSANIRQNGTNKFTAKIISQKQKETNKIKKNSNNKSLFQSQPFYNNKKNIRKIDDLIKQTKLIEKNLLSETISSETRPEHENSQSKLKEFQSIPHSVLFKKYEDLFIDDDIDIYKDKDNITKSLGNKKKSANFQYKKYSLNSYTLEAKRNCKLNLNEKKKESNSIRNIYNTNNNNEGYIRKFYSKEEMNNKKNKIKPRSKNTTLGAYNKKYNLSVNFKKSQISSNQKALNTSSKIERESKSQLKIKQPSSETREPTNRNLLQMSNITIKTKPSNYYLTLKKNK